MGPHKSLINTMILLVKQYIYASRCTRSPISFIGAMCRVHEYYTIEKAIAYKKNKVKNFIKNGQFIIQRKVNHTYFLCIVNRKLQVTICKYVIGIGSHTPPTITNY